MKRNWLRIACRIVIAAALAFMCFATIPWLGQRPLTELPTDYQGEVPAWAKSFSNDHGRVLFQNHGTIHDEPIAFALRVAACAGLMALLLVLTPSSDKPRDAS
jgi:hypothetical protein